MNKKQIKELVNRFKVTEAEKQEADRQARVLDKALKELKEQILELADLPKDKEGLKEILGPGENLSREFGNFALVLNRRDDEVTAHTRTTVKFQILEK